MDASTFDNEETGSVKTKDNIFVRSDESDYEPPIFVSKEVVPPEEDLLPKFIGIYPPSSPSQAPTELFEDEYIDPLQFQISQEGHYKYFSAEDLSIAFASYCPSLSFDKIDRVGSSSHIFEKSNSSNVPSLQRTSQSYEKSTLVSETGSNEIDLQLRHDVKAALLWAALSLGLGIWLYIISAISKSSTENEESYRKEATKRQKSKAAHLSSRLSSSSFQQEVEKELCLGNDDNTNSNSNSNSNSISISISISNSNSSYNNSDDKETNNKRVEEELEEYLYEEKSPTSTSLKRSSFTKSSYDGIDVSNDAASRNSKVSEASSLLEIENKRNEVPKAYETKESINEIEQNDIEQCHEITDNADEEPFYIPMQPLISDLSIPPGLSASSSMYSRQSDNGEAMPDDASTDVLTRDDIYTGGGANVRTSNVYYLSHSKDKSRLSNQDHQIHVGTATQRIESSLQKGPTNYLALVIRCDDSKSTVNLLTDNEDSQRSNRCFTKDFAAPPAMPFAIREGVHDFLDYDPIAHEVTTTLLGNRVLPKGHQEENNSLKARTTQQEHTNRDEDACNITNDYNQTAMRTGQFVSQEFEAIPLESDHHTRFDGHQGKPQALCIMSLAARRMIVVLSCSLILISVMLCIAMGISQLYEFQNTIKSQFDFLVNEIMNTFAAFDSTELYLLLSELVAKKEMVYFDLDDYCPEISTSLCDYNFRSSSCNLEGVPLEESWEELLVASDRISQVNPNDPLLNWLINGREYSLDVFPLLRKGLLSELKKWNLYLSVETAACVGMALLALSIFVTLMHELTGKCWQYKREKPSHLPLGKNKYSAQPLGTFSFCSGRAFAVIFWSLFLSTWIIGMSFSIARGTIVDICNSDQPSFIFADQFAHWHEKVVTVDSDLSDFLKQQFQYCEGVSLQKEKRIAVPNALTNRIETLARLVEPIQAITDGLLDPSFSGSFQDTCGSDSVLISRAIDDMGAQLCNDAQFASNIYLDLMSCHHSSWVPLYESLVNDTICSTGLQGVTWIVTMQVAILFFGIVLWAFRPSFLHSSEMSIQS